jgi:hypothetical protein
MNTKAHVKDFGLIFFIEYLLTAYYVPGTILDPAGMATNNIVKDSVLEEFTI